MWNISLISKKERNNVQSGQTMVEFLITSLLVLLLSFAVIEIARLVAFKNALQASASYVAHKISLAEMNLPSQSLEKEVTQEIAGYLDLFSIGFFSYGNNKTQNVFDAVPSVKKHLLLVDLKLVHDSATLSPGVYLEVQTCLPVLFSSFFNQFEEKTKIGRESALANRDCLGLIHHEKSLPNHWFRVRVAAYSPWSVSSEIIRKGIGIPNEFQNIDSSSRSEVLEALQTENLPSYFYEKSSYQEKNKGI